MLAQETGWFAGTGEEVAREPTVEATKLTVLPELGLVAGTLGGAFIAEAWQNTLSGIGSLPSGELGNLTAIIQAVADQYPEELEARGFGTVLAYWRSNESRVWRAATNIAPDFSRNGLRMGSPSARKPTQRMNEWAGCRPRRRI